MGCMVTVIFSGVVSGEDYTTLGHLPEGWEPKQTVWASLNVLASTGNALAFIDPSGAIKMKTMQGAGIGVYGSVTFVCTE